MIISKIIKIASKLIIAQNIKQFKKVLKQKLDKDKNLQQLDKTTLIGNITKQINDSFTKYGFTRQNYQNKALDFIIQKLSNINTDELLIFINNEIKIIIDTIKNYDYMVQNFNQYINKNLNDHTKSKDQFKDLRNINSFENLDELTNFINKLQQKKIDLEQKKVIRNQQQNKTLPFKKINSIGSYNLYEVQDGQFAQFNKLYGNDNNSKKGGLILTTKWCVALNKEDFDYFKKPYYLITDNQNNPEALFNVHIKELRDIQDKPYKHNHQQVYKLIIQLLKSINQFDLIFEFTILINYLDDKDKKNMLDQIILSPDSYQLEYIFNNNKIKDWQREYVFNGLIKHMYVDQLFDLITQQKLNDEERIITIQKIIQSKDKKYIDKLIPELKNNELNLIKQN